MVLVGGFAATAYGFYLSLRTLHGAISGRQMDTFDILKPLLIMLMGYLPLFGGLMAIITDLSKQSLLGEVVFAAYMLRLASMVVSVGFALLVGAWLVYHTHLLRGARRGGRRGA